MDKEISVHIGPKTGCILLWEGLPEGSGWYASIKMHTTDIREGFTISFLAHEAGFLLRKVEQIQKDNDFNFPYKNHIERLKEDIKTKVKWLQEDVKPAPTRSGFDTLNIDPNCNADFDIVPDGYTNSEYVSKIN